MASKSDKVDKSVDLAQDPAPSMEPLNTVHQEAGDNYIERLLSQADSRVHDAYTYWGQMFDMAHEDVRFLYDEQWPEQAKKDRVNRPMLTLNHLPQFVFQVVNEARRTKFSINIKQTAGKNTDIFDRKNGTRPYSRSQVMEGLIRDIEYQSKAHTAYCNALQQALEGGFGWLFVCLRQNPNDPFDMSLAVEHVKNRYSVMTDPLAMADDMSDARYCSRFYDMPYEEYVERWPEAPMTMPGTLQGHDGGPNIFWGSDKKMVRVCDYWWKEPMDREAIELQKDMGDEGIDRLVLWADDSEKVLDELTGVENYVEIRRKKVKSYKVRYMRHTKDMVLDGPYDWPSNRLPVVPVLGRSVHVEGKMQYLSLHHYAHDAARMYNYQMSAITEKLALAPKQPFLVTTEQIAGHESEWQNQHTTNSPYLVYNPTETGNMPQRADIGANVTAEFQIMQACRNVLNDTIGIHEANLGKRSNEVSGVALQQRQEQGQTSAYDYVDNVTTSVTAVGEILADMIPRVYSNDVARKVVLPDDTTIEVELNKVVVDEETGIKVRLFSLDYARYSCRVTVGPSTQTRREEFANLMVEWGRSDPEAIRMVRDLVVESLDVPNAKAFSERMKNSVPYEMLSEEDQQHRPPPEPTFEQQTAQMQAQADMAKAQAEMAKAEAEMAKAQTGAFSSEKRAESDQARLQFEVERGLNRQEEQSEKAEQEKSGGESDIAALVRREVAAALAKKSGGRS